MKDYFSLLEQFIIFVCVQGEDLQGLITKQEKLNHLTAKYVSELRLLLEIGKAIVMDERNKEPNDMIEYFRDKILRIKF